MAQTFWGAGGQFDVRGRDAVKKEARRERALLDARAEKSRLGLAEEAMQRRALGAQGRSPLPSTSSVTLPWLFDQVTHGLEKRHAALGGDEVKIDTLLVQGREGATAAAAAAAALVAEAAEAEADRVVRLSANDEEVKRGAWWKKRPKPRPEPRPSLSPPLRGQQYDAKGNARKYTFTTGHGKDGRAVDFKNSMYHADRQSETSSYDENDDDGGDGGGDGDLNYEQRVYKHRFSEERVHDPNSNIYGNLDEAATLMELREAISENERRKVTHPTRDATTKAIVPDPFRVGSDQRMYAYHYWGDRSIGISSPSGNVLEHVRNDIGHHLRERQDRKGGLVENIKELTSDLVLSQHTMENVQKRLDERRKWLEQEMNNTGDVREERDAMLKDLEDEKFKTKKELFRVVQAGILLRRDKARFLGDKMCHRCLRAFLGPCCKTGTNCWGCKDPKSPDRKGCCFHCCSTCLCHSCINKFDVDTHLATLRAKRHDYKGWPCHACCCCCRCTGRKQVPYKKPPYLEYEDNVWRAYQKRVVEWEVERSLGRPKMDAEGGGKRGKRRGKKKKKKAGGGEESMDTGQGK